MNIENIKYDWEVIEARRKERVRKILSIFGGALAIIFAQAVFILFVIIAAAC